MPSKTPKQKSFMAAVANNPKFAKKVGVPSKVGKEFEMKDKKMGMKKMMPKKADGVAKKGKTNTKMPKMAMGGRLGGDTSMINMNPTQTGSGSTGQLMRQRAGAMRDASRGGYAKGGKMKDC